MGQKYKVIWIDDEWDKMSQFKQYCEIVHNILLCPFRTQRAGMEALDANLEDWDAVILDAKMLDQSEINELPKLDGLRNAINHINQVSLRRHIPYFISTGQPDLMDNEVFTQAFGHYYIKERDDEQLISDLKKEVDKSHRRQVQVIYKDSIEKLFSLDRKACKIILDIFEAMHFPGDHPDFDPVLYYNQLRQILEWNFRNANRYAIIPDILVKNNVNLNQCCCYLSGKRTLAIKPQLRYGEERENNDYDRIVPPYIENIMFLILNLGNINSHTTILNENEQEKIESFFSSNVSNSRYLIFSLALQVCEVTLWLCNYIEKHQNIEENKGKCKILNDVEQEIQPQEGGYYEGKIIEVENKHGTFLNVECALFQFSLQIKSRKGKLKKEDVVLFKVVQEPNKKDPGKHFLVADDVHLKE